MKGVKKLKLKNYLNFIVIMQDMYCSKSHIIHEFMNEADCAYDYDWAVIAFFP
jgi:GTP:adenosylcobinamide-phosphate guanylyltransferase